MAMSGALSRKNTMAVLMEETERKITDLSRSFDHTAIPVKNTTAIRSASNRISYMVNYWGGLVKFL
jgi:hypothetical protein